MMYHEHYPLKELNAFRTEAFAKIYCEPTTSAELIQAINDHSGEPKLLIGGGCNLFFTHDFDGLVIRPRLFGLRELPDEDESSVLMEVMASEDWDGFVRHCVEHGYAGLENLSLIPGTVGAAPVQNIGAYGAELKDCLQEVVAIDLHTGESFSFSNHECEFGYRDSVFKRTRRYAILSVLFRLSRNFRYKEKYADLNNELLEIVKPTLQEVRNAVIAVRRRKLPNHLELPNCGSFFKNPYITIEQAIRLQADFPDIPLYPTPDSALLKTSAAFLIDRAGYRGARNGNVGTYPNQALIIVNYGTSDGHEIVAFMHEIQQAVNEKFGIALEPEVGIF